MDFLGSWGSETFLVSSISWGSSGMRSVFFLLHGCEAASVVGPFHWWSLWVDV